MGNELIQLHDEVALLRKANARFRQMADSAPLFVSFVDTDGRCRYNNRGFVDSFGRRGRTLDGQPLRDILGEAVHETVQEHIDAVLAGEQREFELELPAKNDTEPALLTRFAPQRGTQGEILGFHVFMEDISAREQVDEESPARIRKLHQFEHIVSSSTDMLALVDRSFTHLAANKEYVTAFKKDPEEVIGHTVVEVFGEEFFNNVIKAPADRCLAGEDVMYEAWFEFPAYEPKYMEIHYSPYRGADDRIQGFVVNARDATARERLREKPSRDHGAPPGPWVPPRDLHREDRSR